MEKSHVEMQALLEFNVEQKQNIKTRWQNVNGHMLELAIYFLNDNYFLIIFILLVDNYTEFIPKPHNNYICISSDSCLNIHNTD